MQFPLRMMIEVIVACLGGMILWLALVSHRIPDRHAQSWLVVSVVLMAWGTITFLRARGMRTYWVDRVAGMSLLLVGGLMLVLMRVPFEWVTPMFAAVGGILVLRGVAGMALATRRSV
jgi:hypothetical protein